MKKTSALACLLCLAFAAVPALAAEPGSTKGWGFPKLPTFGLWGPKKPAKDAVPAYSYARLPKRETRWSPLPSPLQRSLQDTWRFIRSPIAPDANTPLPSPVQRAGAEATGVVRKADNLFTLPTQPPARLPEPVGARPIAGHGQPAPLPYGAPGAVMPVSSEQAAVRGPAPVQQPFGLQRIPSVAGAATDGGVQQVSFEQPLPGEPLGGQPLRKPIADDEEAGDAEMKPKKSKKWKWGFPKLFGKRNEN